MAQQWSAGVMINEDGMKFFYQVPEVMKEIITVLPSMPQHRRIVQSNLPHTLAGYHLAEVEQALYGQGQLTTLVENFSCAKSYPLTL